jgi:AcrR family transcriptional regulator
VVRGKSREDAILAAALQELKQLGYAGLTIDGVARRAGASKATIYRRWSNKAELVKACLDALDAVETAAIPDTGGLRSDLLALMASLSRKAKPAYVDMLQDLMLAAKRDPALAQALRAHVDDDELSPVHQVLARHFEPHEVSFDLLHEVAEGLLIRQLQRGAPLNAAFARRVVDRVLLPLIEATRGRGWT